MQMKSISIEEYPQLYKETLDNIYLLNTNCVLKFAIDGCFDGSTVNVYKVVEDENQKFYVISLEMLKDASLVCLLQSDSTNQEFIKKATRLGLSTLQKTIDKYEIFLCSPLNEWVAKETNAFFDQANSSHPYTQMNQLATLFYATKKQQDQLQKADLSLPPDFEFRKLEAEDAYAVAEEIISIKSPREIDIIKSKIAHFPSVGIQHRPTNQLASYALNDGTGLISFLYTRKQFRRLGLASLLEQKLALDNMKQHQILPFKGVAVARPRVVAMSKASYLWSIVPSISGEDYWWVSRSKKQQPEIVFYED